jgi:hypothetical protein
VEDVGCRGTDASPVCSGSADLLPPPAEQRGEAGGKKNLDDTNFGELLSESTSLSEAAAHIEDAITDKLAEMFRMSAAELVQEQRVGKYGVDSLVAVELKNYAG